MNAPLPTSVSIKMTDLVPGGTVEFVLKENTCWAVRLVGDPREAAGDFTTFIDAVQFAQAEFCDTSVAHLLARLAATPAGAAPCSQLSSLSSQL